MQWGIALGLPKRPSGRLRIDFAGSLGFTRVFQREVALTSGWPPAWLVEIDELKDSIPWLAWAGIAQAAAEREREQGQLGGGAQAGHHRFPPFLCCFFFFGFLTHLPCLRTLPFAHGFFFLPDLTLPPSPLKVPI